MKNKAGWFCIVFAVYFVALAFVERGIFKDDLAAVVAMVSAMVMGGISFVLLKLDNLIEIRMLEHRIIRKLLRERGG